MSNEAIVASIAKRRSSESGLDTNRQIKALSLTQSVGGMVKFVSLESTERLKDENGLIESCTNVWEVWRCLLTSKFLYLSSEKQMILDQIPLVLYLVSNGP